VQPRDSRPIACAKSRRAVAHAARPHSAILHTLRISDAVVLGGMATIGVASLEAQSPSRGTKVDAERVIASQPARSCQILNERVASLPGNEGAKMLWRRRLDQAAGRAPGDSGTAQRHVNGAGGPSTSRI
jgi:hypothetical protein